MNDATGQQKSTTLNPTVPTKPGDTVSVFDLEISKEVSALLW